MKKLALVVGIALTAAPTLSAATGPNVDPALETTLKKFTEAFNRFEPAAVAAFWVDDGTVITPRGTWGKGRDGVASAFAADAAEILKGTTSTFTITDVRKLGSDLAFLDVEQEAQNARMPDGTTGTMKIHLALLTRKQGGTWKWLDARPYLFVPRDHAAARK